MEANSHGGGRRGATGGDTKRNFAIEAESAPFGRFSCAGSSQSHRSHQFRSLKQILNCRGHCEAEIGSVIRKRNTEQRYAEEGNGIGRHRASRDFPRPRRKPDDKKHRQNSEKTAHVCLGHVITRLTAVSYICGTNPRNICFTSNSN